MCLGRWKCLSLITALLLLCPFRVEALVVLQYHHISDKTPKSTSTSTALFKAHLDFLQEQGFKVLSIEQLPKLLARSKNGGASLPDRAVIITFDDGYRSIYDNAWPLLKKRKLPFTVFVNSKPHDEKNPNYMNWDQLREMAKKGASVANHSDSHPHFLRKRSGESFAQWQQRRERDIDFAQQRIKKEMGRAPKMYAHTYGEYDQALLKLLERKGFIAFGQQSGPVSPDSDMQLLPRFPFGGAYGKDMQDFATKVFSLPFPRLKVVVKDSQGRSLLEPELPAGESKPRMELVSPVFQFAENLQCFASGQGAIKTSKNGSTMVTQAQGALPSGRSRYNCTLHAGGGRFYWYSHLFIRRLADGRWYNE
ncbi:Predicted xylanase/chitin deacetylase [Alteromonadaceae bacterium Bs31]|nr:Predicted xylanase/chitin deacetylase [Alteromonadaceae bacterium Bs31]